LYPGLTGVEDEKVLKEIVKRTDTTLPITTTARNIEHEFYWEDKCKDKDGEQPVKTYLHGGSYKQAFIELQIQKLLENFKTEGNTNELIKELKAARYDVFCLIITTL